MKLPLYAEISPLIFRDAAGLSGKERCDMMIEGKKMGPELGMQSKLAEVGVNTITCPCWQKAMKQRRLLVNNPREMTYEALDIYTQAL